LLFLVRADVARDRRPEVWPEIAIPERLLRLRDRTQQRPHMPGPLDAVEQPDTAAKLLSDDRHLGAHWRISRSRASNGGNDKNGSRVAQLPIRDNR
jgi:hypothetical protein